MKNFRIIIAVGLLAAISLSAQAQEQKRDAILKNHFETIGQDKVLQVKTLKMTGHSMVQGTELPFVMYVKKPDKVRNEITFQGQKMVQAYNGETGWSLIPWMSSTPQDMSGIQLKSMKETAELEGALYNWEKKGHQLEYIGEEEVQGTPVYNLQLNKKNGDVVNYYMDKDSYIVIKQKVLTTVNNQEIETETYLGNYEMIEGMAFPMSMETRLPQGASQVNIDAIEIGVELADSMFEKPQSE